ncbi:hypothetical protein [Escherichia coli]|uniref:hypothetical protein n=1 Tax=Escherichia coli TaxID=562 RepID=UPI00339BFD63
MSQIAVLGRGFESRSKYPYRCDDVQGLMRAKDIAAIAEKSCSAGQLNAVSLK